MYWRRLCNPLFLWLIAAFFLARITNDVFPLNEAFGLLVVSCPGCILRRENTRRWERPFNGELLLLFKHFRRSTSLVFRCKILSVFLWVCACRVRARVRSACCLLPFMQATIVNIPNFGEIALESSDNRKLALSSQANTTHFGKNQLLYGV